MKKMIIRNAKHLLLSVLQFSANVVEYATLNPHFDMIVTS